MRIAIDGRELAGQPTGVGRFLGEVWREWAAMPEAAEHEFVFCAPRKIEPASGIVVNDSRPGVRMEIEAGEGTVWEQRVLPRLARRAQADVLFCPAYSGPMFGDMPLVLAIHDVSFAAHPEWFRWREGLRRRVVTRRAARRAARVITISEFSRREIVEHLGVPLAKVDVIYPGVSRLHATTPAVRGDPATMPGEVQVLYVGSIFNRRHVPETVRAFARLARRHPDARFTIVGDNRTFPRVNLDQVIGDTQQAGRVNVREYVSDAELTQMYARARAFVFLSEYEGFGLTPLEALAFRIPVVLLDTAVAREVCGDGAIYVAAPEPRLIEAALEFALFDEAARERVLAEAATVLGRYSWRTCARGVLNVLVSAAQ